MIHRGHALHQHRPLSLQATIEYPRPEGAPTEIVAVTGFRYLLNLFSVIDEEFVRVWNTNRRECQSSWLTQIQHHLTDALPTNWPCTDIQETDLRITQQWLRSIVWQLSTASGCLSSSTADPFMTFTYPIDIAQQVVAVTTKSSHHAIAVRGIGLVIHYFSARNEY